MTGTGSATETVFTTPDPDEARAVQAMLAEDGLRPETWIGPDPLTGAGDWMYGAAPANFYNLDVPGVQAARARGLLQEREGPARIPERSVGPVEPAPSSSRLPTRVLFAVLIVLVLAAIVAWLGWLVHDLPMAVLYAVTVGSFLLILALALRWARRRAARAPDDA